MAFPTRVRRGTSGNDYYYADGVHAMTALGNDGIGSVLNSSFSTPLVTLSTADFDVLQDYMQARDTVFAQQIANAVNAP